MNEKEEGVKQKKSEVASEEQIIALVSDIRSSKAVYKDAEIAILGRTLNTASVVLSEKMKQTGMEQMNWMQTHLCLKLLENEKSQVAQCITNLLSWAVMESGWPGITKQLNNQIVIDRTEKELITILMAARERTESDFEAEKKRIKDERVAQEKSVAQLTMLD